jgi:hypothetical protein
MKKAAVAIFAIASFGSAATLSVNMTVDNAFSIYVSTSDSTTGTLIGSGGDWTTTYSFSQLLTPGVTNYIHVQAVGQGGTEAFLGSFSLDDVSYQFANGTQALDTDTSHWGMNLTGFGNSYSGPASDGTNGVGPWGFRSGIDASATWLDFCSSCTAYFSTPIAFVGSSVSAPEPSSFGFFGGALLLLPTLRRRK